MTIHSEIIHTDLDYKLLCKYGEYSAHSADEIINSHSGDEYDSGSSVRNYDTNQSRFRSLQTDFAKFLDLVKRSPRINQELKEKIFSIDLGLSKNPRISLMRRIITAMLSVSRGSMFGNSDYILSKISVRIDILQEFRDRMTEVSIKAKLMQR